MRKEEPPLSSASLNLSRFTKRKLVVTLVIGLSVLAFTQALPASGQSAPDFSMSIENQNVTLSAQDVIPSGQIASDDRLFFASLNGFAGLISITTSGSSCGDGVAASVTPTFFLHVNESAQVFVLLQLLDTTPVGAYTEVVTATSGNLAHSLPIYVTVTRPPIAKPDFDIVAHPSIVRLPLASPLVIPLYSSIQLYSQGGFAGDVSLTFGAYPGLIIALNPMVVSLVPCATVNSMLIVEAFSPGVFDINVTGRNGALVHSVNVYFNFSGLQPPETTTASLSYGITNPSAPSPGGLAVLENNFTDLGQTSVRVIGMYYSSDLDLSNASMGVGLPFSLDAGKTGTLETSFPILSTAFVGNHTISAEARWQAYDTSTRTWVNAPSIFIRTTLRVVRGRVGAGPLQQLADFTQRLGLGIFLGYGALVTLGVLLALLNNRRKRQSLQHSENVPSCLMS